MFPLMLPIVTAFIILCFYNFLQLWKWSSIWHIKGPVPLPFLGNVLHFGKNPPDSLRAINKLMSKHAKESGILKISIGISNYYLIVSDPDFLEFFLTSPRLLTKNSDYKLLEPWLGKGLKTSKGSHWQKRRKALTPPFHFKKLNEFLSIFYAQTNSLIGRLSAEKDEFDIYPFLTTYALDCICVTAMGTSVYAQNDPDNKYVHAVHEICNIIMKRIFSVWKRNDFLFQFTNEYQRQKECLKIIHDFTNSVIQKRRKELLNTTNEEINSDIDNSSVKKTHALLDFLLTSSIDGVLLSDSAISEEVDTFLAGGHGTTAALISFALYELSRNPEVQEKLYKEIKEILGTDQECMASINDLNKLRYLEMVLKETLRLYPSAPFFARELDEDITYKGTTFRKGLTLGFFIFYLHRRADLFENPEKFDPERFSMENKMKIKPFSYLPFSAGPRNCIGQKFGMLEAKSCLLKIVQNFEIHPTGRDVILSPELGLKSANGIYVKLKKRI